jgi:ribosomal protein S18 acetylase RimI-like enzyme
MEQVKSKSNVVIREIDWARDRESILRLDASFSTSQIYHLSINEMRAEFELVELTEPVTKRYDLSGVKEAIDESCLALAADVEDKLAGFVTVKFESWNRRAWITHVYVDPGHRSMGIGKRLVREALDCARSINARVVWLETQNFNYPEIQFYTKMGFRFCGFDRSLYDPVVVPGETAIYFSLEFSPN